MKNLIERLKMFIATTAGKIVVGSIASVLSITLVVVIVVLASGNKNKNMKADNAPTEETSMQEVTIEETTTEETTTQEVTTEAQTTTQETTTQEETTTIEVIKIEDLNISDDDLSSDDEVMRGQQQANMTEPVTEKQTQPSNNNQNTSTAKPKPALKPTPPPSPVNEYSCLVYGIDVSKWQGNIDWAKVKAAGYNFVMIKCAGRSVNGNGQLYVDKYFEQNIQGALSNGIQVGVYFFSQALNEREAQEEASLVIDLLRKYKITYPVTFDWETSSGWRTSNTIISKDKFTNIVNTFCTMVKQAGYEPMVYGNYNDLYRFDIESIAKKYKVWYARWWDKYQKTSANYVAGEPTPTLNFAYQMWQYKSTGKVPGISGNVDMNVAFFSYSGSGVPSRALELSVKNKSLTTNVGASINLKNGVSAKSTAGTDISSSVTYVIKNKSSVTVSENVAFSTPGTYTITYNITDFTGAAKSATATLIVRGKPVITLAKNEIVYFKDTDSAEKTANDIAIELQNIIKNNVTSAADYEGKDIKANTTIVYPNVLYLEDSNGQKLSSTDNLTDAVLSSGEYVITYKVRDSKNLENTAKLSLKIIDINEAELEIFANDANSDNFANVLAEKLRQNLSLQTGTVNIAYSNELNEALSNHRFASGDTYEVIYSINDLESNVYYKKLIIKIIATEEETTFEGESSILIEETTE